MLIKLQSIRKLFDRVTTTLDEDAMKIVRKACSVISAIWFVMPIFSLVCTIYIFCFAPTWKYYESSPVSSQLPWNVNVFIFVHSWFNPFYLYFSNNITAIYAAFLFGANKAEQLFFARVQDLRKTHTTSEYKTFITQLHELVSRKTEFDSVMSILPMLVLSYIFTSASGYFLYMKESYSKLGDYFAGDALVCSVNLAAIIILVFMVDHYNCKTRANVLDAKFYLATVDPTDYSYKFTLINELDHLAKFEYTLWSMAKLNREFILSYLSSLITFTVLFYQLASDNTKAGQR
ncbi:hypothetical protein HDE_01623 [Halotydeus destructor]|nr:hypothetical protein HDE_01623 [Halotydeus destructor]